MEKLLKFSKTIRTNWKKSIVGVIALYYAGIKSKEKYEISILMKAACKEAVKYGDSAIQWNKNPTVITVILNPAANKRKAKSEYEKYCEPLLHLAGLQVDVVQTQSEGNAKEIVESLSGTQAIIVAGGDGTLSETITGLLRRSDEANRFPIGVLPLGRTNSLGNTLFPGGKGVEKVKQLIDASMAIIKGETVLKDAIKIEPIPQEGETPNKPIYAMSSFKWGAFRDTLARKDKYWLYGPLREYAAFIFNGYKEQLTWNCTGTIKYTPPCKGCSNCIPRKPEAKRKWSFFAQSLQAAPQELNTNPDCANKRELCFKTCQFEIRTRNIDPVNEPALNIILGKNTYSYFNFVLEGWRKLKSQDQGEKRIQARTVELMPNEVKEDNMIEIDNEEFEVKPIKITLLPKVIKLFCKQEINSISAYFISLSLCRYKTYLQNQKNKVLYVFIPFFYNGVLTILYTIFILYLFHYIHSYGLSR